MATKEYDMRRPALDRDAGPEEFVGVYLADDGQRVPCTAKPSKRQPGKLKIEYTVIDVSDTRATHGPLGCLSRKSRIVWAIVDADRVQKE